MKYTLLYLPHIFRRLLFEGGVSQTPYLIHQHPKAPDVTGSGVLAVVKGLQETQHSCNMAHKTFKIIIQLTIQTKVLLVKSNFAKHFSEGTMLQGTLWQLYMLFFFSHTNSKLIDPLGFFRQTTQHCEMLQSTLNRVQLYQRVPFCQ